MAVVTSHTKAGGSVPTHEFVPVGGWVMACFPLGFRRARGVVMLWLLSLGNPPPVSSRDSSGGVPRVVMGDGDATVCLTGTAGKGGGMGYCCRPV